MDLVLSGSGIGNTDTQMQNSFTSTNLNESAIPFPQVQCCSCVLTVPRWIKMRREIPHLASCDARKKEKKLISIYTAFVPGTKYPPATVSRASRDCFRSCRSATIFFSAFPLFESRPAVQTEKCAKNTESFTNGSDVD